MYSKVPSLQSMDSFVSVFVLKGLDGFKLLESVAKPAEASTTSAAETGPAIEKDKVNRAAVFIINFQLQDSSSETLLPAMLSLAIQLLMLIPLEACIGPGGLTEGGRLPESGETKAKRKAGSPLTRGLEETRKQLPCMTVFRRPASRIMNLEPDIGLRCIHRDAI